MSAFATGFQIGIINGLCRNIFGFMPMPFVAPMPFMPVFPAFNCFTFSSYQNNYAPPPPMPRVNFDFSNYQNIWTNSSVTPNFPKIKFDFSDFSQYSARFQDTQMMDTFVATIPKKETVNVEKKANITDSKTRFDKMVKFVYLKEGGYNPNDCGQPGNYGILQSTYDSYLQKHNLPHKDVKNITKEEADDLYYNNFWLASGADKIADDKLSLMVFDTAVNMGVSRAKQLYGESNSSINKYKELRLSAYSSIAQTHPEKSKYLNGWQNRVNSLMDYSIT